MNLFAEFVEISETAAFQITWVEKYCYIIDPSVNCHFQGCLDQSLTENCCCLFVITIAHIGYISVIIDFEIIKIVI